MLLIYIFGDYGYELNTNSIEWNELRSVLYFLEGIYRAFSDGIFGGGNFRKNFDWYVSILGKPGGGGGGVWYTLWIGSNDGWKCANHMWICFVFTFHKFIHEHWPKYIYAILQRFAMVYG